MTERRKGPRAASAVLQRDAGPPRNIRLDVGSMRDFLFFLLNGDDVEDSFVLNCELLFDRINMQDHEEDPTAEFVRKGVMEWAGLTRELGSSSNAARAQVMSQFEGAMIREFGPDLYREAMSHLDDRDVYDGTSLSKIMENLLSMDTLFMNEPRMFNLMADLKSSAGTKSFEIVRSFKGLFETVLTDLETYATFKEPINKSFVLGEESAADMVEVVSKELNKEANLVKTGIKEHNKQLGGGYQAGRVYLYVGRTGGGKSMLLLNAMRWFHMHNPGVDEDGVLSSALYLSLENDQAETMERLFDLFIPISERDGAKLFKDYPPKDAAGMLKDSLNEKGGRMIFEYRPNKSVNPATLGSMISAHEKGMGDAKTKIRLLVVDYVKRLTPTDRTHDLRLDLGSVVDELSVLAKRLRIPVVTATQMNAVGISALEEAQGADGKSDAVKWLGTSVVGESKLMIENADYAFVFNNEENAAEESGKMFTVKKIKGRGRDSGMPYLAHPYAEADSMLIQDDADLPGDESLSRAHAADGLWGFDPNEAAQGRSGRARGRREGRSDLA